MGAGDCAVAQRSSVGDDVNRAARRSAARGRGRGAAFGGSVHLGGCDCVPRTVVPLDVPVCPACGAESPILLSGGAVLPTSALPGDVILLELGCGCGRVFEIRAGVE